MDIDENTKVVAITDAAWEALNTWHTELHGYGIPPERTIPAELATMLEAYRRPESEMSLSDLIVLLYAPDPDEPGERRD
jgi:hypothetical protein